MAAKKKVTKKKASKKKAAKKSAKKTSKKAKTTASKSSGGSYKASAKPATKSQIIATLAEKHELPKKKVGEIFETLFDEIVPGEIKKHKKFNLFSYVKFTEKKRPARKARKGVNPFTGESITFKAKPASKTVKSSSLKKLKDLV